MVPKNLQQHFDILQQRKIALHEMFVVTPTPMMAKILRKHVAPFVNMFPLRFRFALTNMMKKFRNPRGELTLRYLSDAQEYQAIRHAICHLQASPWWQKKAVICVSHDVDNLEGYQFVGDMAELDAKYDIRSTFNFLTHDYVLDSRLIESLAQQGFEIGLHGRIHDQGLAFRRKSTILRQLKHARNILGAEKIVGFRSPALSISHQLLGALGELNFLYDSTMQIASPFYHSVRFPYPFYLPSPGIWEVPLMVQDDNYLRDTHTPEPDILESIERFIHDVIAINGVLVINMHPHLMNTRKPFYERFLQHIRRFQSDVAYCSTRAVVEYAQGTDRLLTTNAMTYER
jgi:hypothetical protein